MSYRILADLVLVIHALFVGFVVFGLLLILIGRWRGWGWVRSFWFRLAHLLAIGLVVVQAWIGVLCPLTILEQNLRRCAGDEGYAGGFVAHHLHRLLFFEAEPWVFTLIYTLFGAAVLATLLLVPPRRPRACRRYRADRELSAEGSSICTIDCP